MLDLILDAAANALDRGRPEEKGSTPWWWLIVGGLIAAVGLAAGWWLLGAERRELAQLRRERFRADQARITAQIDSQIAADTTAAAEAIARADVARTSIATIDLELQAVKLRHAQDLAAVDRIRSWRDVAPDPEPR